MSRRIEDLDQRCQDAARKTLDALTADDELRDAQKWQKLVGAITAAATGIMGYLLRGLLP